MWLNLFIYREGTRPLLQQEAINHFVNRGLLEREDATRFSEEATAEGKSYLNFLIDNNHITRVEGHRAYAALKGWAFADLGATVIPADVLALLPASVARQLNVVPISANDGEVIIVTQDPSDSAVAEVLKPLFPKHSLRFAFAPRRAIEKQIAEVYSAAQEASRVAAQSLDTNHSAFDASSAGANFGLIVNGAADGEAPQILGLIIEQALRDGASDIHFEPTASDLRIRYRINGALRDVARYPIELSESLSTLINVRCELPPSERRVPLSGGMTYPWKGRDIDIRVETAPTVWGNEATMRLQSNTSRTLEQLGFSTYNLELYSRAFTQPFGMILATGPTGSGKTTTLMSTLGRLTNSTRKIVTLENPVENKLREGASQTSINVEQGLTFAAGLRSILRRDPDIILIGEIRDDETAEIAVDAALTGHLMLSTLHTNDAPGAIARLSELKISPFLLSSSLLCVIAQRLAAQPCSHCKIPVTLDHSEARRLGFLEEYPEGTLFRTNEAGCERCGHSGIGGRVPLHEVMLSTGELEEMIASSAPQRDIARVAREQGMRTLRQDGWEKANQGLIDPYALAQIVQRDM